MLKNRPHHVDIREQQWQEMMQNIREGIFRKLKAANHMAATDKEIGAGLYIYAIEEFGKLLLLKNAEMSGSMRRVIYRDELVNHEKKFRNAFDYFQANDFDTCIVLSEGDFVISDVVWSDAVVGLLANTESRLSIFYSDFSYDNSLNLIIERPPTVNLEMLRKASYELERAAINLTIPFFL